ncbi:MAG TPA: hypothetical protein VIM22_00445 [Solirubrobacteraceae bacterium]|jgi:hypothetical protein
MLLVSLICSDPACAEETELWADSLDEVAQAACDCGCTLEILAVSDAQEARLWLRVVAPPPAPDRWPARAA